MPLVLALSACGGGGPDSGGSGSREASTTSNAAGEDTASESSGVVSGQERSAGGPNIAPTAAPGVAFNYRYAFRLAGERISEVQEQHASRCEQLGPDRCRIVGFHFLRHDDDNVEGRLSFRLEPSIARAFGREAVGAVVRADGLLVESEITGTDVAPTIRQAGKSIAELRADLARIEARLAGRLAAGDRGDLEYQAQELRSRIRAVEQNRQDAQESLATTPMTFVYGSGRFVPGPQPRRAVSETLEDAWDNFLDAASILFVILATLLPWALLALLVWLAVRWVRRRWFRPAGEAPAAAAAGPDA